MAEIDIRQLAVRLRDSCVAFKDGAASRDRKEALQFYNGTNLSLYGDSGDGLSTVVSRDTMEAIESMMPPLLRPFVAGEEVVSFDPIEPGDEESTKQATEYVNHCFRRHNNTLHVAQSGLKDGLLFRLGIAKTVMEEVEQGPPETFEGLDDAQLAALRAAAQAQGREVAGDIKRDEATGLYSATVAPPKVPKFRVYIVAPDEFLYEERLAALEDATFVGHSRQIMIADLIAMGIDEKKAKALGSGKPESSEVSDERFDDENFAEDEKQSDDLSRKVYVDEGFILCDYQGTGVLEWRKVMLGGNRSELLLDEPADDHPYSAWTPIPVPHKLTGKSIYDLTKDVQMQKTAITREALNAIYLLNRPQRAVVDGQVNMDDLLQPALGGIVRVKQLNAVMPLETGGQNILGNALTFIEYLDGVREARTGVTRYNQGMDSNSLNKTATGMNIIASNSQQRQELVARQFGEFLKDVFKKLFGLIVQHAKPEEVSRVTGRPFVPWPTDYDMTVTVGLGTNNKDQLVGHLMSLLQLDKEIIQLQGGLQGPLLTAANVHEKLKKLTEAMGLKGNDRYYTDPAEAEAQAQPAQDQPPEDPLAEPKIKAATDIQIAQIDQQTEIAKERMRQEPVVVPIGGYP